MSTKCTFTLKVPTLLDHLHFIDLLTGPFFTVLLIVAHSHPNPPPWGSIARSADDVITMLLMFLFLVSATVALPGIILWFLFPSLINFVEIMFPLVYAVLVLYLAVSVNVNTWVDSPSFMYSFRSVTWTFTKGMGGLAVFKFYKFVIPMINKGVSGFAILFTCSVYMIYTWG